MRYDDGHILVERLSWGEEEAYVLIYDRYYDMLCLLSCFYVKDDFIAETIVGDVIFKLWNNRGRLPVDLDLRKYLIKAVKNSSINYLNHAKSYQKLKERFKKKMESEQYPSDYPIDRLLESELDILLQNTIDSLPELTRNIFEMSRFENLKYKEISDRTGLSIDSVKYHIKSALKKLRSDVQYVIHKD